MTVLMMLNFVPKVVCQPSTSKSIGIRPESERENDTPLEATPTFNPGAVDLRNNDSESNELERSCEDIHEKSPISTMNTSEDLDPDCGLTFDYDIGHFVSRKANDLEKSHMLKNKWQARPGFKWPFSMKNQEGKKYRSSLKQSHIDQFQDFAHSEIAGGVFCKLPYGSQLPYGSYSWKVGYKTIMSLRQIDWTNWRLECVS